MMRLSEMNYRAHNEEVKAVWDAFHAGNPIRTPVICGVSSRWAVLDARVNWRGVTFREYAWDPRLMFEMQAEFDLFRRMNIPGDHMMGPPEDGLSVEVDFQNYYEAGWLGADVRFLDDNVPYAVPLLQGDNRNLLFDQGIPDPFSGLMGWHGEYHERFLDYAKGYSFNGHRVAHVQTCGEWTDGPMTLACELRGADNFCLDLLEAPDYACQLLDYLTDATITRIQAWRAYLDLPLKPEAFHFADDSAQLLSPSMYREFLLPRHRRLKEALTTGTARGGVHLCGDAAHLFTIFRDELDCYTFDTGFPVDHEAVVRALGPEVCVQGGPNASLVAQGTPEEIAAECKRILAAVEPHTKKFVLRDGNDIPPNTPFENIWALANATKQS